LEVERKVDAIAVAYEKDEVWGTRSRRRTLAFTRPDTRTVPVRQEPPAVPMTGADLARMSVEASTANAFGPEATVRAREMDYELTTRIQQESPYIHEEVVEHKVHDYRLYVGMWVVAGTSGVMAFLTYSLGYLAITGLALVFALISSPGRQYED
jgi:hypothetical protein